MATLVKSPQTDLRHAELADLLRTRRERLTPQQVGLPAGSRRRVRGLRREEVAELADISTTWYTWLEQGRGVNVSESTLDRLATVLHLDGREREHLFLLAGHSAPPPPPESAQSLLSLVQQTLDSLSPSPAYLLNSRWDVLAWNRAAALLFGDFASIPAPERNIVWLTFQQDSQFSRLFVDWERYARCVLGNFRVDSSLHAGDPAWSQLTTALQSASPIFASWWPNHEIAAPLAYKKEMLHAQAGRLVFEPIHLYVQHPSQLKIVAYMPTPDTGTAEGMVQLLANAK